MFNTKKIVSYLSEMSNRLGIPIPENFNGDIAVFVGLFIGGLIKLVIDILIIRYLWNTSAVKLVDGLKKSTDFIKMFGFTILCRMLLK